MPKLLAEIPLVGPRVQARPHGPVGRLERGRRIAPKSVMLLFANLPAVALELGEWQRKGMGPLAPLASHGQPAGQGLRIRTPPHAVEGHESLEVLDVGRPEVDLAAVLAAVEGLDVRVRQGKRLGVLHASDLDLAPAGVPHLSSCRCLA